MVYNTDMLGIRPRVLLMLLLLVLAGAFLRFYNLGHILLYLDEPIHSVRIDYQSLPFVLAHNNGSAFFAILVHFLLGLGKIETMSRLPSAIFGVLTILAVYVAGARLFNPRVGGAAATLLAFSPFCIQFSQYSRGYATFLFMAWLSMFWFLLAWEKNRLRDWVLYLVFTVLAIYTHLMGIMLLPVYAIYSGGRWLTGRFQAARPGVASWFKSSQARFLTATAAVAILVVLLYLPDQNVRGFLAASVGRIRGRLGFGHFFSYLSRMILSRQIQMWGVFPWILGGAVIAGFAVGLKRHLSKALFFLLCLLLPLSMFVLLNPRPVNIQSADRYFIFVLPVLFIWAAVGLDAAARSMGRVLVRKDDALRRRVSWAVIGFMSLVMLVGFNYGHYYVHFWRFSTLSIPDEVDTCLRQNLKQDGLIHFAGSLASGNTLVASLLTRDPPVRGSETVIHSGFTSRLPVNDYMVFKSAGSLRKEILSDISLWVVVDQHVFQPERLRRAVQGIPDTEIYELERHAVIHIRQTGVPLYRKIVDTSAAFLTLDLDPLSRKEWLLRRARASLLGAERELAFQALNSAHAVRPTPEDFKIPTRNGFETLLDGALRLSPEKLRRIHFGYYFERDLAEILWLEGEKQLAAKEYEAAAQAYRHCARMGEDYGRDISGRLFRIANVFFINDQFEKALALYQQAAGLHPTRAALQLILAEAWKETGRQGRAVQVYRRLLGPEAHVGHAAERLLGDDPLILVQEKPSGWRIIFRAQKRTSFSGKLIGSGPLRNVEAELFKIDDVLYIEERKITFAFQMDKRRVKILDLQLSRGDELGVDILVDDRPAAEAVLIWGRPDKPQGMPLFLRLRTGQERRE
jgi:tetratricopeptide (TPR) repeat protein